MELQRTELTRVSYVASKAAAREAAALKEEGTVPFSQYKDEVRFWNFLGDKCPSLARLPSVRPVHVLLRLLVWGLHPL